MKSKKILLFTLILFLLTLVSSLSISCDCQTNKCECWSDCSQGFLDIYKEKCKGLPEYEISIYQGKATWLSPQKGEYHLKILCDNNKKSDCKRIVLPFQIKRENSLNFFPYLILLSIIVLLGLLLYHQHQRKKEWDEVKNKVKNKS